MNTMEEILKNTHSLNEAEIDYHKNNYKQIKKEINTSETILRQNKEEAKEFIEQLNNLERYGVSRDKDGKVISRGLNQFLDTSKQRDLLVAIWVISQSGKEDLIQDWGIKIQNEETFEKMMIKISQETRRAAKKLDKKNPTPEEVKKVNSGEEEPEKEPDDRREEEPDDRREEEPEAEELDTDDDDADTDDGTDDKPFPPVSDEEPKKERTKKTGADLIDSNKYPAPEDIAKEIEEIKEKGAEDLKAAIVKLNPDTRWQKRTAHEAERKLRNSLDKLATNSKKQQTKYEDFPTENSARQASINAQKNKNNAKGIVYDTILRYERSKDPTVIGRSMKKAQEVGSATKKALTAPARTRTGQKAGAVIERVKQKKNANTIEKAFEQEKSGTGKDKRQEYINLLLDKKFEEAEKIYKEALDKMSEAQRKGSLEKMREGKPPESKSPFAKQNEALKNYGKKLYELADNPATRDEEDEEKKEDPKVAKTAVDIEKSVGANQAKEYMKLSKSSDPKDLEKAASILKSLESKKKESERKLGIKESNKSLKRVLRALYN